MKKSELLPPKMEESIESSAWRNFSETYKTVHSYIMSDLRKFGLTPPQYSVMRSIATSESRKLTMSEIGKQMVVTFANVTTIVDNLEKLNYVRRLRDLTDRRCIEVELTLAGLRIFQKIHSAHVKEIEKLMKTLSRSELANLMKYTSKLKGSVAS